MRSVACGTCTPATPMIRPRWNRSTVFWTRCSLAWASCATRPRTAAGGIVQGDFKYRAHAARHQERQGQRKHAGFLRGARLRDKWLDEYEFVDVMRLLARRYSGSVHGWSQRGAPTTMSAGATHQFATPELAETARVFDVIDKAPTYELRWSDHAPLTITYDEDSSFL